MGICCREGGDTNVYGLPRLLDTYSRYLGIGLGDPSLGGRISGE